ncbi:hypothetical protein DMX07_21870 [Pseudomonas soli]|uniref:Uncharacterized protein n=1 Tax=Pseudomonas soli TaxID=1306993 RepID=A0A2V4HZE2_9PSED|nr:hypothetical protein DMX07_21870 [Pseudomonas soli]
MYVFIFLLLLVGAILSGINYPSLIKDPVNTLGFLGFWITLFGLIVAIFEIMRTGSVTRQMAHAAEVAHNRLKRQMEHHDVQACIEIINAALSDLNSKKAVSVIFISRIKQGYIALFSKQHTPERYRENLDILNSYEHVVQSRANRAQANPTYAAPQYPASGAGQNPYRLTIDTLKRMQDELLTHSASKNEYIGEPA